MRLPCDVRHRPLYHVYITLETLYRALSCPCAACFATSPDISLFKSQYRIILWR